MTGDEALETARSEAVAQRWPWPEPIGVRRIRRWWFGKAYWEIFTNHGNRGGNVRVEIDDATGTVMLKSFNPR